MEGEWRWEVARVASYQWRGTSGVQPYVTGSQILYTTDELFSSSVFLSCSRYSPSVMTSVTM
jgi:hypothetical protein